MAEEEKTWQDITKLSDSMKEVSMSNKFILKRLNQLTLQTDSRTDEQDLKACCSHCQHAEEDRRELKALKERVDELEEKDRKRDLKLDDMFRAYEGMQELFRAFQGPKKVLTIGKSIDIPSAAKVQGCGKLEDDISDEKEDEMVEKCSDDTEASDSRSGGGGADKSDNETIVEEEAQDYESGKNKAPVGAGQLEIKQIEQPVNQATGLSHPNFQTNKTNKPAASANLKNKLVIRHTQKKFHNHDLTYNLMEQKEVSEGMASGLVTLGGVHTVIILDISASMAEGNAWDHVCTFFNDFINGLEKVAKEHPGIEEEHVAIAVFGHKIECIQRLTKKFDDLRKAFEKITLGGPSPMIGGMKVGLGAAASSQRQMVLINEIRQNTKIFIVSDGRPTNYLMYHGPDVIDPAEDEENKLRVMQEVESRMIHAPISLTIVPVGDADHEFLSLLAGVANGEVVSYNDGGKLARRTYLMSRLPSLRTLVPYIGLPFLPTGSSSFMIPDDLSSNDKEICMEIIEDIKKDLSEMVKIKEGAADHYEETNDTRLPTIGSRVIRGPDWKWLNQDSHGPGTVIGHVQEFQVFVEWDADGHQNVYRYGAGGEFDLLLIEEYRKAYNGRLEVGCLVTQGQNWKGGKTASPGVVIRKVGPNNTKVEVRWQDGTRGTYSYGEDGLHEVEPSQTTQKTYSGGHVLGYAQSSLTKDVKKNKNKNKNVT